MAMQHDSYTSVLIEHPCRFAYLNQILITGAISTQKQLDSLLRERMNLIILLLQLQVIMLLFGKNAPVNAGGRVTKTGNIAKSVLYDFYFCI